MPAPTLSTRPPTGVPPWPLIVIEGVEKSGKTYSAVELAADPRIGHMFGADLGEGSLDEYGPLAAGKMTLLNHDGTYRSLADQLWAAREAPRVAPDLPNAILLDTGTDLWWSLARWIEGRARYRAKNIDLLAKDPDAELDIGRDLWNDAAERWRNIVEPLRTWDGIAIITVRGGWVSGTDRSGQPTRTQVWSQNAHKSLPFDASVIIRMDEGRRASIVAARSLTLHVPHGGAIDLPEGWKVADVVFDKLGLDGATTHGRALVKMTEDWPVPIGKLRLVEAYQRVGHDEDSARTEAREAWRRAGLPDGKTESVDPAKVVPLIEAATGPVAPQEAPDAVLVPAPVQSGSTGHVGASSAPPDDGQEPDPPTDDHPADVPPAPPSPEDARIEGIRAWVETLDKPTVTEVLAGCDPPIAHPAMASITSLRKLLREALIAAGYQAPPVEQDPPGSIEEAWSRYLVGHASQDELYERAQALGVAANPDGDPFGGPVLGRLVRAAAATGEWPRSTLVAS